MLFSLIFFLQQFSGLPQLAAQPSISSCPSIFPDGSINIALNIGMNATQQKDITDEFPALNTECLSSDGDVELIVDYEATANTGLEGIAKVTIFFVVLGERIDLERPPGGSGPPTGTLDSNGSIHRIRALNDLTNIESLPVQIVIGCDTTEPDAMGHFAACSINASVAIKRSITVTSTSEETPPEELPETPPTPGGPPDIAFVSPKCVPAGKVIRIHGIGFDQLEKPLPVTIGGIEAQILVVLPFVVHARVPMGLSGVVEVSVDGITDPGVVDINPNCGPRALDSDDLENGFLVGEIVMFLADELDEDSLEQFKTDFGFEVLIEFPTVNMLRGVLEEKNPPATRMALDLLNIDSRIDEAFLNHVLKPHQSDPDVSEQTWLSEIGLPDGWDLFFPNQGSGITIAIIDSGADLDLPLPGSPELEFDPNAPEGLDYSPVEGDEETAQDELGHGTAVSTIAAGSVNDYNGVGVAPNATILPIKVFSTVDGEIVASNHSVAQALEGAFSMEVDVINLSLGCYGCDADSEDELRKYYGNLLDRLFSNQEADGMKIPVIVASAGNDGEDIVDSPAAYSAVIAVGSVRSNLTSKSSFSNYGEELDFLAIGESAFTTLSDGEFGSAGSGTSFAAPQVTGLVALILSEDSSLSADEVLDRIIQCFSEDLGDAGFDVETGWGRIVIPNEENAPASCLD
jgi:subtilisin family serine protease